MTDLYRHYKGGFYRKLFYARETTAGPLEGEGDHVLFHAKESTNGPGEGMERAVFASRATGDVYMCGPIEGRDRVIYVSLTTGDIRTRAKSEFEGYVNGAPRFKREP